MEEAKTLEKIKEKFKKSLPSEEFKKNTQSAESWARYAHKNNLWYPVAAFKDGEPHCYISHGEKFIEVYFLDERMFEYIYMAYRKYNEAGEKYKDEKMFLTKIYVRKYNYKEVKLLQDLNSDQAMIFTPEGKLTVRNSRIFREPSVRIQEEEFEAKEPVNVSHNWLPIPKFGEYEYLCYYSKILKEGDLVNKPTGDNNFLKDLPLN